MTPCKVNRKLSQRRHANVVHFAHGTMQKIRL
nr:MAG TPA: hypothetical protein [Caudoviricetes sp.]DAV09711.1 MAG TPA: hypothetical protein [Caudoviricetes sp.]